MHNLSSPPAPFRSAPRWSVFLVAVGLVIVSTVALSTMSARASSAVGTSSIVSADRLLEHGITLQALPDNIEPAKVSADSAQTSATRLIGASAAPEVHRVLASATYDSPKTTAWLFLFAGGPGPISAGPAGGVADSRSFSTDFTGVLVDDQTGEILRWFQGGSFKP
jgi:hypothetical protein